jgi:hypothetical protein
MCGPCDQSASADNVHTPVVHGSGVLEAKGHRHIVQSAIWGDEAGLLLILDLQLDLGVT